MKNTTRILSLLLVIVMVFSLLPMTVLAGPGGGAGGEQGEKGTKSTDGTWWGPDASNYQFMRFSLYFAETDASTLEEIRQLEAEDKLEYMQLGKTIKLVFLKKEN